MSSFTRSFRAALCWLGAVLALTLAGPSAAQYFPERPPIPETFLFDGAGLIEPSAESAIDEIARALSEEEQIALVVVTISSLETFDAAHWTIERYAQELFDSYGIGSQERNYGILLLVSEGDRKARIELGAGWGFDHDLQAAEVMETLIVPRFREGDFSGGILAGVRGLDAMARGLELPKPKPPWWSLPALVLGVALTVGVIVSLFKSGRSGWGWALLLFLGAFLLVLFKLSGSGSGGGYGGGSSGGGGATGSW